MRIRRFGKLLFTVMAITFCVKGDKPISGAAQTGTLWQNTTACYGSDDRCSKYSMQCKAKQKIVLGTMQYGTKLDVSSCKFGISNCLQMSIICCQYNETDALTSFSVPDANNVTETCLGKQSCEGWAPRMSSSPYSIYVIIQYACVDDSFTLQMCQRRKFQGVTHSFIEFSLLPNFIFPSINGSRDCACKVSTKTCLGAIHMSFISLQFERPSLPSGYINCSGSSLKEEQLGREYNCSNVPSGQFSITIKSVDVISITNLFTQGHNDRPSYLLMLVKGKSSEAIDVECGPPGISFDISKTCLSTTATSIGKTAAGSSVLSTTTTSVPIDLSAVTSPYFKHSSSMSTHPSTSTAKHLSLSSSPTSLSTLVSTSPRVTRTPLFITSYSSHRTYYSNTSHYAGSLPPTPSIASHRESSTSSNALSSSSSSISVHLVGHTINTLSSIPHNNSITTTPLYTTEKKALQSNMITLTPLARTTTEPPNNTTVLQTEDNGIDKGLLIGLIVGILAALAVIFSIIICLCLRIKRREKERRNYIRNTNIFYSYPDDKKANNDTLDIKATCSLDGEDKDNALIITANELYEPFRSENSTNGNEPVFDVGKYIIQPNHKNQDIDIVVYSEDIYIADSSTNSSNEYIEYINDVEDDEQDPLEGSQDKQTCKNNKLRVTFDPSSEYATVSKEGKTKF